MIRKEGMHFYINIPNLDQVVIDEETKTGKVNHSLHALDTFFSMIESFGKKHFPQSFVVEKITGSRLHMYVTDSLNEAFEVVAEVSGFAYKLTSYLNHEIAKYKTLLNFQIQIGFNGIYLRIAHLVCFFNISDDSLGSTLGGRKPTVPCVGDHLVKHRYPP